MAKGKKLAEWSMTTTSVTYMPGPAGSTLVQANFEGTATGGFGTIGGTATFVGGKSGTMSYCGAAYLDNGDELSANGPGTYESTGKHHWHTQGILQISDGSALLSEGELDLSTRKWSGTVSDWS
jgi:hypothetical protein